MRPVRVVSDTVPGGTMGAVFSQTQNRNVFRRETQWVMSLPMRARTPVRLRLAALLRTWSRLGFSPPRSLLRRPTGATASRRSLSLPLYSTSKYCIYCRNMQHYGMYCTVYCTVGTRSLPIAVAVLDYHSLRFILAGFCQASASASSLDS